MLVKTKRRTPAAFAASARFRLPSRSVSDVSVLRRRVYPAALVTTASTPCIAASSEARSSMSPRTTWTSGLPRTLALLPGRTSARTCLPRATNSATTWRPRNPVPPDDQYGLGLRIHAFDTNVGG